jgi:hypothetical protein
LLVEHFLASPLPSTYFLAPDIIDLADNSGTFSIYSPATAEESAAHPVTFPWYQGDTNSLGYHSPDRSELLLQAGYGIGSESSLSDAAPAWQASALDLQVPWQDTYHPQHDLPTTIHNGTFIGGNVNNSVRYGESGMFRLNLFSGLPRNESS